MAKHSRLDPYIAECLRGSGRPVAQRMEAAEELRSHLEQRVAAHVAKGMDAEYAFDAALAEFGPPHSIRAGFRRRHLAADMRYGFAMFRRRWWWPAIYALLCGVVPLVLSPGPLVGARHVFAPPTHREAIIGIALNVAVTFALQFLLVAGMMVGASACESRFRRPVPLSEFRFWHSVARWGLLVAAGTEYVLTMGLCCAGPMFGGDRSTLLISPILLAAWRESLPFNLAICVGASFAGGLCIAWYARRASIEQTMASCG